MTAFRWRCDQLGRPFYRESSLDCVPKRCKQAAHLMSVTPRGGERKRTGWMARPFFLRGVRSLVDRLFSIMTHTQTRLRVIGPPARLGPSPSPFALTDPCLKRAICMVTYLMRRVLGKGSAASLPSRPARPAPNPPVRLFALPADLQRAWRVWWRCCCHGPFEPSPPFTEWRTCSPYFRYNPRINRTWLAAIPSSPAAASEPSR